MRVIWLVLFNVFQKKSQKTPKKEIEKALSLKADTLPTGRQVLKENKTTDLIWKIWIKRKSNNL